MNLPSQEEIMNMWLKYNNTTVKEIIAKHPHEILEFPDWFMLYPVTQEQDIEWRKEVRTLLNKKYKISKRMINRGWWVIELQIAPYVKIEESKMTNKEFNTKYEKYLEPGFNGLSINLPELTEYLDRKFTAYVRDYPNFQYSQIKLKFERVRIYCKLPEDKLIYLEKFCQEFFNKYKHE